MGELDRFGNIPRTSKLLSSCLPKEKEMNFERRLFNINEAMKYIGIDSRSNFNKLVQDQEIGFKIIGKRKKFTKEELGRWLSELNYHTDCTSGGKSTTSISHLKPKMEKEYSLEKVLAQQTSKALKGMQSKDLANSNQRKISKRAS